MTPFGVYVHVPFCRERCDYCAFATYTDRDHLMERYADACVTELGRLAREGGLPDATSVFFGGGTPSRLALTPTGLTSNFSVPMGWAAALHSRKYGETLGFIQSAPVGRGFRLGGGTDESKKCQIVMICNSDCVETFRSTRDDEFLGVCNPLFVGYRPYSLPVEVAWGMYLKVTLMKMSAFVHGNFILAL